MLGRISKENQRLFIDSKEVIGIQDFSFNYDLPIDQVKTLGMETVTFGHVRPVTAEITVNKLAIDQDNFINYTGDTTFSGYVTYKDKYFAFNSGILNNYSISCAIGEIPSITTNLTVLGEFGENVNKSIINIPKNDIKILNYSDIEVNLDEFTLNRLQNIDISIDVNRNIIYSLDTAYPVQIITNPPIVTNLVFTIKADDYQIKNIRDLICQYKIDQINILFREFKNPNGPVILSFNYNEAIFLGETYQGSVGDSSIIALKYQAFSNASLPSISTNPIPKEDTINLTNNITF